MGDRPLLGAPPSEPSASANLATLSPFGASTKATP